MVRVGLAQSDCFGMLLHRDIKGLEHLISPRDVGRAMVRAGTRTRVYARGRARGDAVDCRCR